MQPKDLDVADQQPRPLDCRQHFRKSRDIAARKDIFRNPRIGHARALRAADRMQNHHAVVGKKVGATLEEGTIVIYANMLEHADRNYAIEWAMDVTIVLQDES